MSRHKFTAIWFSCLLTSLFVIPLGGDPLSAAEKRTGVDLGVGTGESHRPNILVAWRNTERILEVEVLVRNLGDEAGRGKVTLDLCDEDGKALLSTQPFSVSVPSKENGGDEGTIVQTKGFRLMNLMFDQLDRLHQRYKLRARVETEGDDLNPADNIATKSFNVDGRALSATKHFYRYRFMNPTDREIEATVVCENSSIPSGWTVEAEPKAGAKVVLKPREVLTGNLIVKTPKEIENGQFIDFQVSIVADQGGQQRVIDKDEWYLVATDKPCEASKPTLTLRPDGSIAVNVVAHDPICGIKEASGAQVSYSLDDGATFSTRVLAYARGNFYNKTWFEAVLGPFAPGVNVTAVVTVENNAGLIRRFDLDPIKVIEPKVTLDDAKK